jgi:carbonic anhydrase
MPSLDYLLEKNRHWADSMVANDAEYFSRLAKQQAPDYLWIGCSDSRVPANQVVDLAPGEVFVHRNVGNLVVHSDLNCLSVLHYAVSALRVKHVLVVGHYGCGGVRAVMESLRLGLVDNWLRHLQDIKDRYRDCLGAIDDTEERVNRLCELNVIEQVVNVCSTTTVRDAWARGQQLAVHGWAYSLENGLVTDLGVSISRERDIEAAHLAALEKRLR